MNENSQSTAEELAAEESALKESKVEEIRTSVIEKYGLDEVDDSELIDKLSNDFVAQQKAFGKVVSQKRSWRDKATGAKPLVEQKGESKSDAEAIRQEVEEKFLKRDLDDIEVSEELKEEIKKLAKMKDLTIRQAFKDPYIVFLKGQEDQQKKLDKSVISGKKNGIPTVIDTSKGLDPSDFDMSTKEGRDAWDKAKKAKNNS
jgi:hypothetical protein